MTEKCRGLLNNVRNNRVPLEWRPTNKEAIELKEPKYELSYNFKKDRDPDSERAKLKQLQRQSKRESKAAMRELRRDAEFLDTVNYQTKLDAANARRDERAKNFAFMEDQQANMNLQVRLGGELIKGGGSANAKKARVKRK